MAEEKSVHEYVAERGESSGGLSARPSRGRGQKTVQRSGKRCDWQEHQAFANGADFAPSDHQTQAKEALMTQLNTQHRSHPPAHNDPDPVEPGSLPVEPDEGQLPPAIPDDPEHHPHPAK